MTPKNTQSPRSGLWRLAQDQHGVVTRAQLLELGYSPDAVKHRIWKGRLHPVWRGVYAVGRPQLGRHGMWLAAVLSCGSQAALSHDTAASLWKIRAEQGARIEVSVPAAVDRRRPGIVVHRRCVLGPTDITRRDGIPVTTPLCTLLDLATRLPPDRLEAAANEADKRDLLQHDILRAAIANLGSRPGAAVLRSLLEERTFSLTDSELERRFLPLVRKAGLPQPETGRRVNGYKVDFYWPRLRLVVETDGLRYHRTPAQQARDRLRDQAHTAAGLTPLRFTHAQVVSESRHVEDTLAAVARRATAWPA